MSLLTLFNKETGEAIQRAPVDAREILRGGEYVLDLGQAASAPAYLIDGVTVAGLRLLEGAGLVDSRSVARRTWDELVALVDTASMGDRDVNALRAWHAVAHPVEKERLAAEAGQVPPSDTTDERRRPGRKPKDTEAR